MKTLKQFSDECKETRGLPLCQECVRKWLDKKRELNNLRDPEKFGLCAQVVVMIDREYEILLDELTNGN